jgi:hypothetical protein
MLPGSTLFVDACAQRDFWPGGAWSILSGEEVARVLELFALAARLGVRQGGVRCWHASAPPGIPVHCLAGGDGASPAPGCAPARTPVTLAPKDPVPTLDRAHAYYLRSGCLDPVDAEPTGRAVFDHLTAGVRDAVVFGAGVEYALAHAIDALLHRRIRTHVALDAAAAADSAAAQRLVAAWKRRGVDGATTATIARLLTHAAR